MRRAKAWFMRATIPSSDAAKPDPVAAPCRQIVADSYVRPLVSASGLQ